MARAKHNDPLASVPSHERHFYSITRAFGRFGMRRFAPECMRAPHWHGHVEVNLLQHAEMTYQMDAETVHVPADRLVMFWAGIPHQLTDIRCLSGQSPRLQNIYVPVDAFLLMPHIADLQVELIGGAVIVLPQDMADISLLERWYGDYRANDFERLELMKMELNAVFRRAQLAGVDYLRAPNGLQATEREISSNHTRHVVSMLRYILENLDEPMSNADVTAVTGLHENYALSLFSRTMRLPLKRFIIRMRLMRSRALLVESSMAIASVAAASGFTSISQFYDHFKTAYGISPGQLRAKYKQMALR